MKYTIKFTNRFKKDLKTAEKQNRNINLLFEVIDKLANGKTLEARYRDHPLKNQKGNVRDCHIESDWILLYEYYNDILVLLLHRIGSHSELDL